MMALSYPSVARSNDDAAAGELAAIMQNARAMGVADARVATALEITATQLARIHALIGHGDAFPQRRS